MRNVTNPNIEEIIFTNGSRYFDSLLEDIDGAKQSIYLETYIFNDDKLGESVAQALANAATRGVKTFLLVDGAGVRNWTSNITKKLETNGVETRIFHPFPWRFWQWSRSVVKKTWVLKSIHLFTNINSRNHRKVCIIDNSIVYIGSMNISQCHLDTSHGGGGWRDMAIKLTGINVKDLINAFNIAWNHQSLQERIKEIFHHVNTNPTFRLNNSRHRRRILYKNLLRRISRCKNRVWITNAYFVPDRFLLNKLKDVARAGIDVRILLPQNSDVIIMPWASTTFYQNLLKTGVRIFEYIPTMLHAKTLILDDWIIVGSSNLNHRSLLHDLEVDVNIRLEKSKQIVEQQFLNDLKHADEIRLDNWQKRPLYQRIIGQMLLYLKYWI